nr:MAG TPA: hypothetical protein [Caudoviricetes sp.]
MDKLMDRMVRSLKKPHLSINYGQNLQTTYCLKWY